MVNSQEGHKDEGSHRNFTNSTLITPSNMTTTLQLARGSTGKPQAFVPIPESQTEGSTGKPSAL